MSAIALALPIGLAGCLPSFKDPPPSPPPDGDPPPIWSSLTVGFFHQQIGNPATGWITTVTVPTCHDSYGFPAYITASVNNGSLVDNGNGTYTWTRVVTGAPPVSRVAGAFTAICTDDEGRTAHPNLAVVAT